MKHYRLVINPEREPGDDDDHHGGEVDRDDVEGELPGKQEVHLHTEDTGCGTL